MAAILCDSIGKMCNALSQGCSLLGRIPVTICGGICKYITNAFEGHFCIYTTVAFATSIPVFIISLTVPFQNMVISCPQSIWMIVNGCLSIINILAAIYISNEIERSNAETNSSSEPQTQPYIQAQAHEVTAKYHKVDEELPIAQATPSNAYDEPDLRSSFIPPTQNQNGSPGSFARLKYVLCYDSKVALYIAILIFFMFWQIYGVIQMFGKDSLNIVDCPGLLDGQVFICILLGAAFIFLGGCALTCSICYNVADSR